MSELKNLRKGDKVILHMFTGIAVGLKEVLASDAKTVTIETRKGEAKFSKSSGLQIEPKAKSDRFANFITEDDGSFVPKEKSKKTKEKVKKTKKARRADDTGDEEEEKETIPSKRTKDTKRPKRKSEPEPEEPEEDEGFDEDDYEEVE